MTTALFIALEFPPLNNTGVHRSAKLVKYLRDFGVEPVVVALHPDDAAEAFGAPLEPALMKELPEGTAIYSLRAPQERLPTTQVGRALRVWARTKDSFARRVRASLRAQLTTIANRHKPSVVYVSLPPFSAGGLALDISRELGLPLVVDMRDGWSHWCAGAFPTYAHWRLVRHQERRLFEGAAAVVTVTEQLATIFRVTHPDIPSRRFVVIPNGFDGDAALADRIEIPTRAPDSPVTIGYVGRFYYSPEARASALTPWWRRPGLRKLHYVPVTEDWLYRSPHFLFRAIAELRRRQPELGRRFRFALVGETPGWLQAMALEHGVADALVCHGHVPHAQVLELTRGFDAQLCTSVKVAGGEDYALASKTFDYVSSGRPILGMVTRGSQREFLAESGLALLADPDDLESCVAALVRLAKGGLILQPNRAFLGGYHRRALAQRMADVLSSATHRNTNERPSAAEVNGTQ